MIIIVTKLLVEMVIIIKAQQHQYNNTENKCNDDYNNVNVKI